MKTKVLKALKHYLQRAVDIMMRTDKLTSSLSDGSQFSGPIRSESAGPAALGLDGGRRAHLLGSAIIIRFS